MKTISPSNTKKIAGFFGRELLAAKFSAKFSQATVIALRGNLGAGKTTFVQGFLRGLGVRSKITSPTFVILKKYKLKNLKTYKFVYHLDCYRVKSPKEVSEINFKEIFANPSNIVLIEWPERISKIIPKNSIRIKFDYGRKENERKLIFDTK